MNTLNKVEYGPPMMPTSEYKAGGALMGTLSRLDVMGSTQCRRTVRNENSMPGDTRHEERGEDESNLKMLEQVKDTTHFVRVVCK